MLYEPTRRTRVVDPQQIVCAQEQALMNLRVNAPKTLYAACLNGNLLAIKRLVKHGLTLQTIRANYNYALTQACRYGHLSIVEYLVAQGLTVVDLRVQSNLPLFWAVYNGHLDIVQYLMARGLTVEDLRSRGNFALAHSCQHGRLHIVEYLVDMGLTVDDIRGKMRCNAALKLAAGGKHIAILQLLVWAGKYTQEEVAASIKDPELLAQLIFEQPEPPLEDLVKPANDLMTCETHLAGDTLEVDE